VEARAGQRTRTQGSRRIEGEAGGRKEGLSPWRFRLVTARALLSRSGIGVLEPVFALTGAPTAGSVATAMAPAACFSRAAFRLLPRQGQLSNSRLTLPRGGKTDLGIRSLAVGHLFTGVKPGLGIRQVRLGTRSQLRNRLWARRRALAGQSESKGGMLKTHRAKRYAKGRTPGGMFHSPAGAGNSLRPCDA
jgi:hypothetical protein